MTSGNNARDDVATQQPIISFIDVSRRFGNVVALENFSLDVAPGEIIALIGSSGSGKTTVLRTLVGLESIDRGAISINGEVVAEEREARPRPSQARAWEIRRQNLGMVFQSFNLFPHRTALENVIEAPIYRGREPRDSATARGRRILETVGLGTRVDHYPSQLSGGQQQRVAIARALAMNPAVVLFDEVTSALDPELTAEVLSVMHDLADSGQTMLVVTHEIGFARQVANRVIYMDHGRIVEEGPPSQVIDNPRTDRARDFLSTVLRFGSD